MNKIAFAFKNLTNQKVGSLEEKWKYDSGSILLSSPVVEDMDGDGKKEIVFGTKDGKIHSIDINGNLKWTYSSQEKHSDVELMFLDTETSNSINASPNINDINNDGKKEIVFGTEAGILYAINFKGNLIWKYKTGGAIRGSALIQLFSNKQTGIFVGSMDKNMYFLNANGKLYWKFEAKEAIESCPALIMGKKPMVVFGANDGIIYSVDLTGKLLWEFKTKGKITAQAVFEQLTKNSDKVILVGSNDGTLYCISEQGELIWSYDTEGAICSRVTISDINKDGKKEIVFGSCDNNVYALDNNGKKLWSYETDFWVVAPPIVSDLDGDGKLEIVVGSYDHNIYVLDSEGSYMLDYVPGISGIVSQTGSSSEAITQQPGKTQGKKLWQYQTEGIVVGCAYVTEDKNLIVNIEPGKVKDLIHKRKE